MDLEGTLSTSVAMLTTLFTFVFMYIYTYISNLFLANYKRTTSCFMQRMAIVRCELIQTESFE